MAKGMRLRLLSQGVIFARVNAEAFIEAGGVDDRPEVIPYDAELVKAIVNSGKIVN